VDVASLFFFRVVYLVSPHFSIYLILPSSLFSAFFPVCSVPLMCTFVVHSESASSPPPFFIYFEVLGVPFSPLPVSKNRRYKFLTSPNMLACGLDHLRVVDSRVLSHRALNPNLPPTARDRSLLVCRLPTSSYPIVMPTFLLLTASPPQSFVTSININFALRIAA